jgi:hypothetical protein
LAHYSPYSIRRVLERLRTVMDRLTISIDPEQWGNLITKYQPHSPRLKEEDFTAGTINLDTDTNGALSKRKGSVNYNTSLLAAAPKDQYEAIFSDGARHLLVVTNGTFKYSSGDTIFNSVTNGSGFNAGANFEFATTQDRVYGGNKVNPSIVYDRVAVYGGAAPVTVPAIRTMGVQVPATAPTAGAPTAGGSVPNGAHTYKVTFQYYGSEESNGSAASGVQTATTGNNTIPLTAIPIGGYGVTARNIYRDNNDANWVYVGQVANNTATTFSDSVLSSATPTPIPTNNGNPPIFGLICSWLDRLWLAQVPGDPNTLFYSEVSQPDIYGAENQVFCNQEDPITALIVYFDRLVVLNRRSLGQIIGNTPDTFRYAAIPSSVGCVDNRTIQIHVLHGVPVLIWLSERGFYTYDGNALEYISDPIEDLINFNIRQAIQQKNSNSQTTFLSGTASNGIETTLVPGSLTTRGYDNGSAIPGTNPKRTFTQTTDWEDTLATKTNVVTQGTANQVSVPLAFSTTNAQGSNAGTVIGNYGSFPGMIILPTVPNFAGESHSGILYISSVQYSNIKSAWPISVARDGTTAAFSGNFAFFSSTSGTFNYKVTIWNDSFGSPGSVVAESILKSQSISSGTTVYVTPTAVPISYGLSAGVTYWIGIAGALTGSGGLPAFYTPAVSFLSAGKVYNQVTGVWNSIDTSTTPISLTPRSISYTFNQTPVASSGIWTSPTYDSKTLSSALSGMSISQQDLSTNTTYLGTPSSSVTYIEGSNNFNDMFPTWTSVTSFNNLNSTQSFSPLASYRWWRIRIVLTTPDNRQGFGGSPAGTPAIAVGTLKFNTTSVWESPEIDCTANVTVYDALTVITSAPSGTTATVQIATSATSGVTGTYVTYGSHVVRQFVKIKVTLTANTADTISASLSSILFKWTLVANYKSPSIDTGVTIPAGWDVFLAQLSLNSGSVQFQLSSAPTSGQLGDGGHPFTNVTVADFPVVPAYQFVQWKVIITSSDNAVPVVDSVTVQWFIGVASSVRPASIFVDGRYYVALAELNNDTNNLIIELDLFAKWRRLSGMPVSTFSYFFNRPYFGLATSGQIRKFLEGTSDAGIPIELDVRTKSFDWSTQYKDVSEKHKIITETIVHAKNTGAALQFQYSTDEGTTWYAFYDNDGNAVIQTDASGEDFFMRLKPKWDVQSSLEGQRIMYRVYSNDAFAVQVHSLKLTVMVRKHVPLRGW